MIRFKNLRKSFGSNITVDISPVKWSILAMEGAVWRNFILNEMLMPCGILLGVGILFFSIGLRAFSVEGNRITAPLHAQRDLNARSILKRQNPEKCTDLAQSTYATPSL